MNTLTPTEIRIIKLDDETQLIVDAADNLGVTVGTYWKFDTLRDAFAALTEVRNELRRVGVTNATVLPVKTYGPCA